MNFYALHTKPEDLALWGKEVFFCTRSEPWDTDVDVQVMKNGRARRSDNPLSPTLVRYSPDTVDSTAFGAVDPKDDQFTFTVFDAGDGLFNIRWLTPQGTHLLEVDVQDGVYVHVGRKYGAYRMPIPPVEGEKCYIELPLPGARELVNAARAWDRAHPPTKDPSR